MDANDFIVKKLEKGLPIITDYCNQYFYGQVNNLRTSETILEQDDEVLLAV